MSRARSAERSEGTLDPTEHRVPWSNRRRPALAHGKTGRHLTDTVTDTDAETEASRSRYDPGTWVTHLSEDIGNTL